MPSTLDAFLDWTETTIALAKLFGSHHDFSSTDTLRLRVIYDEGWDPFEAAWMCVVELP